MLYLSKYQKVFQILQVGRCHMERCQEVSRDVLDVVEKRDHCVTCVLTITGYFVKHRILQQYLNDQENVLKTSHKLH